MAPYLTEYIADIPNCATRISGFFIQSVWLNAGRGLNHFKGKKYKIETQIGGIMIMMNNKKKVWTSLILVIILAISMTGSAYASGGFVDIVSTTQSGDTFWAQLNYSSDVDSYDASNNTYGGLLISDDVNGYCGYVSFPITSPYQWASVDVSSCASGYYDVYVWVPYAQGASYEDWKYNVYIN
jgi:hypothetical protein